MLFKTKPTQKLNFGWEKNCYEKENYHLYSIEVMFKYI